MELELTPRPDVYFTAKPGYITSIKIIVGFFSSLSLVGAIIVILSQIVLPQWWKCKYISRIVRMLSVADALIAISHIWGITQNVEKFLEVYHPNGTEVPSTDIQCTAQAALAIFGTVAAFLWTLILAIYIFSINCMEVCISICKKPAIFFLQDCFAWGFPLLLVIVFAHLYLLGYGESADIGWCYVSLRATNNLRADQTLLVAYELWVWLSLTGIFGFSLAYVAVAYCKKNGRMCYKEDTTNIGSSVRVQHSKEKDQVELVTNMKRLRGSGSNLTNAINHVQVPDINWRPFLAVMSLLLLRSFNTIDDIWSMTTTNKSPGSRPLGIALLVIFTAIGDSIQGLVNMLLFVVCRPQVYNACSTVCKSRCKCKRTSEYSRIIV